MIRIACILLVACLTMTPVTAASGADRIVYIDSYNAGYAWSDGIFAGVEQTLTGKGVTLKTIRLDTKRNRSESYKTTAALRAKSEIEAFSPDVIIAADDNASKYLIMPYFRNVETPVVFCGVNWNASVYGFPCRNVTGMIEVAPVPQLLAYLKRYAGGGRVGFLAPDLLSARKETDNYRKDFNIDLTEYYSKSVEDWKKGFIELQQQVDMLIIDSDGGLYQDHEAELVAFVEKNTRIPSGAILDFMAPYALITFAKVAEEQGSWAAETALKILKGASPASIPIARNVDGQLIVNARIAQAAGFDIPYSVLKSAYRIIE